MKKQIRLGVIGAGWWATTIQLPYFAAREDVRLVGVARLGHNELQAVQAQFGFEHASQDYRAILALGLDAVVVASPHTLHCEHARAALEANCHVLVEKPLATRGADARTLLALAETRARHLVVPQGWSFTPYVQTARRLVAKGAIGAPRHLVCQMASATGDLFAGQGLTETAGAAFRPAASTWADPQQAGGYGWGQLVHALGVLFSVVDLQPEAVFALMGRSPSGADYYDALSVRFAGGATAAVSGAATLPKPLGSQHDRAKGYQIDLRVFGSEGVLLLDIERERLVVRRDDGDDTMVPLAPGDGDYPAEAPYPVFLALCKGEAVENPFPALCAVRSVEVLDAAYRSATSGRLENV